jgi:hypothetical protein
MICGIVPAAAYRRKLALNSVNAGIAASTARLAGGAPLWAAYAGQMDYGNRVLGVPIDRSFVETMESCGLHWTLDGICFAAERPSHINRDGVGQVHVWSQALMAHYCLPHRPGNPPRNL